MSTALTFLKQQPSTLPAKRPSIDLELWWKLSDTPLAMGRAWPALRIALEVARYEADHGRFPIIAVPPGTGKTRIGLELAAREAALGRTVVFAEPTVALATEKEAEMRQLGAEGLVAPVPTLLATSALTHCLIHLQAVSAERFDEAERIARAYNEGGRQALCGVGHPQQQKQICPHAGPCQGYLRPEPRAGCVMFCTHALLERLTFEEPEPFTHAPLLIIDESPKRVRTWRGDRKVLRSLIRAEAERVRTWRREHPKAIELIKHLTRIFDKLMRTHLEPDAIFSEYLPIEVLADGVRTDGEALDLFRELFDPAALNPWGFDALEEDDDPEAEPPGPPSPPEPSPKALRNGQSPFYADPSAWILVRRLYEALRAQESWERPPFDVSLRCDPGKSWTLELRAPFALPEHAAAMLLDATGDRMLDEWRGVVSGRQVTVLDLCLVGARPRSALHLSTRSFRTPELFIRGDRGAGVTLLVGVAPRIVYAISRAIHELERQGCAPGGLIGLITHKPLANILRATPVEAEALAGVACRETQQVFTGMLTFLQAGWRFKIGHYGADDRATNRFSDVDLLLLLGDPRPDWGSSEADARALDMEAGNLFSNRTMAKAVQACHRARHLSRHENPPILVYVGRDAPVLVDITWTVEEMPTLGIGRAAS